jgi:hypothetical protein
MGNSSAPETNAIYICFMAHFMALSLSRLGYEAANFMMLDE